MLMTVFFFGAVFDEVYMFSVAYIVSDRGFATEFVLMFIRKICAEFNIVIVSLPVGSVFCFAGHCTETVIVAFAAFIENHGAAGQFVYMLLFVAFMGFILHGKAPFFILQYDKIGKM